MAIQIKKVEFNSKTFWQHVNCMQKDNKNLVK